MEHRQLSECRKISKLAKLYKMLSLAHGVPKRSKNWALNELELMAGEPQYWEWAWSAFESAIKDCFGINDHDELCDLQLSPDAFEATIAAHLGIDENELSEHLKTQVLAHHKDLISRFGNTGNDEDEFRAIKTKAKALSEKLYERKNTYLQELQPDEYHQVHGVIHPYYSEVKLHGEPINPSMVPANATIKDVDLGSLTEKLSDFDTDALIEEVVNSIDGAYFFEIDFEFIKSGFDEFLNWFWHKRDANYF